MKKFTLSLFVAGLCLSALSFSSCKKCSTCTIEDSAGKVVLTHPEFCGKKSENDAYRDAAAAQALAIGGHASCD